MRVRIIQHPKYRDYWHVEVWRWWLPFWCNAFCTCDSFDEFQALDIAKRLKHPATQEIA